MDRILSTYSYGICLFSMEVLQDFLKKEKIRETLINQLCFQHYPSLSSFYKNQEDFFLIYLLYPLAIYPFLRIFPQNGHSYTVHPTKSFVLPALLHINRFALANNIWNRCMFFAIPRYTTFEYPICFFTMRNGCSTLQRTADFSCSIFLSQLRPFKSSAILRLEGRLFIRNSILDFFSSSLIAG